MKIILETLLVIALGYFAHQYFPFWALAIVAGLVGFFFKYKNSLSSFMAGFLGGALLWGGMAWFLDSANGGLLSGQLGELFSASTWKLIYGTGFIGGLIGGLAALTGTLARGVFRKETGQLGA